MFWLYSEKRLASHAARRFVLVSSGDECLFTPFGVERKGWKYAKEKQYFIGGRLAFRGITNRSKLLAFLAFTHKYYIASTEALDTFKVMKPVGVRSDSDIEN